MGSKKHKKHHRSEKKESKESKFDRQEKPLKLVLKVGTGGSLQAPGSPSVHVSSESQLVSKTLASDVGLSILPIPGSFNSTSSMPPQQIFPLSSCALESSSSSVIIKEEKSEIAMTNAGDAHHSHEKHKKSKKKKKKKSSDREKHPKRHKHRHHHHHHRENSRERKRRRDHDHGSKEPPLKRQMLEPGTNQEGENQAANRDPRTCTLKKKSTKTSLQMLLCYLLKNFQKKDPQQFFAWPVSDVIAPGYSSIIGQPMDFSTMKNKIDAKGYSCLADFKYDLKLMCDNAMAYNRPDTIYFKAAKKMWHGQKLFNKEHLMLLSRNLPFILEMNSNELGFDPKEIYMETSTQEDGNETHNSPENKKIKHKYKHLEDKSYQLASEEEEDSDTAPDEILVQAQKAAKGAADRLTLQKPNTNFAFLRQRNDGSTTLALLNPTSGKKNNPEETEVNLEMLVGKLNHGAGSLAGFKEDPKNMVRPVKTLNYGSFCSYAPQYDSMFSNLTMEESSLVLNTYGDELGAQYAESLLSFAKDCDYVMNMVDNMLDALTGGTHSKTIKQLEERRRNKDENSKKEASAPSEIVEEYAEEDSSKNSLQQKLDETSGLLQDLEKAQRERLSSSPPLHLSNIQGANSHEIEIADKVTKRLTELAKQAPPSSVIGLQSIRKAMGISYHPISSSPLNNPVSENHSNVTEENKIPEMISHDLSSEKNLECDLQDFLESNSVLQACEASQI